MIPDALMQTIRGFQDSRVLLSAIELDVFTAVGTGATAQAVAAHTGTDARATEMLLNALVALEVLQKQGDTFINTPEASQFLVAGGMDDSRAALMHTVHLWDTWSHLTESIRAGMAVGRGDGVNRGQPWTEAFIAAMHRNATERAPHVVRAVPLARPRRMLDVGGGSGAYSIAFARAHEALKVDIMDLPAVIAIARRHIADAGLQARIRTREGDLTHDPLGEDYDLVLLSAICHMLGPTENRDLLARCFAAVAPGGQVVVQDFILDASKTVPKAGALFALNMLVGTRSGSAYAEDEYREWLREAGFSSIAHVRLPGPTGLMIGRRS